MTSLLKCIFRNCFEKENDDEEDDETSSHSRVEVPGVSSTTNNHHRCNHTSSAVSSVETCYHGPPSDNLESFGNHRCRAEEPSPSLPQTDHAMFSSILHRFRMKSGGARVSNNEGKESNARFLPLTAIHSSSNGTNHPPSNEISYQDHHRDITRRMNTFPSDQSNPDKNNHKSSTILKEAHSFEFNPTKEVPALTSHNQFILPGSEIQRKMAQLMKRQHPLDQNDECVICMDVFAPENPRMPTLCGCGENKTFFHLPCLYQWIEKSRNCPSCRKPLIWEEF